MIRKLAGLLAAVVLAGGVFIANPSPTLAFSPGGNCQLGATTVTWSRLYLDYVSQSYTGALSYLSFEAAPSNWRPCAYPSDFAHTGDMAMLGANLERLDGVRGVQLGISSTSLIPTPKFIYTPNDHNGGGSDVFPGTPTDPQTGHRYQFQIYSSADPYSSTGYDWTFCITDTTSPTWRTCNYTTATWTSGRFAWWGAEVHNTNTTLGHYDCSGCADFWLYRPEYRLGSSWVEPYAVNFAQQTNDGSAVRPYYHIDPYEPVWGHIGSKWWTSVN